MPYLSLPMGCALTVLAQWRERVLEKLESCSKQQVVEERKDVLHSSLLCLEFDGKSTVV